jgi:hypothetical protein
MEEKEEKPQCIKELEACLKGAVIEEVTGWWGGIPVELRARKGDVVFYIYACCACNSGFWYLVVEPKQ